MSSSIVEYFSGKDGSSCGYCKGKKCSFSHGMWAHVMTVEDYQDLIDRGWRRSGRYCYKPTMNKTCCPQYTIRCNSVEFKPSKSHKKVLKRFRHYIIHGSTKEAVFTPAPPTFQVYKTESDSDDADADVTNDSAAIEAKASEVQKKLKLSTNVSDFDLDADHQTPKASSAVAQTSLSSSSSKVSVVNDSPKKVPRPGTGPDPSKPKCRKAKDIRKERALKKLEAKGINLEEVKPKAKNAGKSLEDFLNEPFPENSAHHFETRVVVAQTRNPEFMKSFEESLQVYRKYQVTIHKDTPEKCSPEQFTRFLCDSSLTFTRADFVETDSKETLVPGYGAFHQQYFIDGKLVCVGVIDILPTCLSSVYLYYDPDYKFLSFGTLSSLFELKLVRQLAKIKSALKYYYMGFYIHSCPKMRYKAQYNPSEIVCPETFNWIPVSRCLPLLDKSKYSRLCQDDRQLSNDVNLDAVGVLYRRQAMQYCFYREIRFSPGSDDDENDGDDLKSDEEEVREYSMLVGSKVSNNMLLYRS